MLGAFLLITGRALPALAQPTEPWLDRYEAEAVCPAPGTFRARVRGRLVARPDALARWRVQVEIRRREPGSGPLHGRVNMLDGFGVRHSREVADASCDALAHALSLIVALGVDEAEGEAGAGLAGPGSLGEESLGAGAALPASSEAARARAGVPGADGSSRGPEPTRRRKFGVEPFLKAAVQSALRPGVAWGGGMGVALEWSGSGFWNPRLELAGMLFDGPGMALPGRGAEVRFEALMLGASLCPLEFAEGVRWSLRPCVDLDAGRLTATGGGRAVSQPERRHAPWFSSGVSLRASASPGAGPVQLFATLGGFLPLFRPEFYFAPDIAVFEVPAGGWRGAAGVAVAF